MRLFLRVATMALCVWFLSLQAVSQQLNWANSTGGPSTDISTTVAKDNAGNVYIAGKFSGANVDFDPSAAVFPLSSAGGTDCFVAKYNAAGQFQWAFRFGGTSLDEIHGIALDQNDNFFITGYFRGINIDFDPGAGIANVSSNGDAGADPGYGGDIFIAKYTSNGVYQWAFNIGGTDLYDAGIGISTDAAGNVYAGGYFTRTADFDPGPGNAVLNSAVTGSIFLAKYSNAGAYQWAFGLGSPITNNSLFDIKTDAPGNVYITGYYQGTNIDFDPGAGVAPLNAAGGYEVFVAKYNANGQYQFAFSVGGTGWDVARGIGLDAGGNIYVIGDYNNTVDFDPGPGTAFRTSNGQGDAFLAKYSPTGQYLWAFGFGGTPNEYGSKVIIDDGHVFITGSFTGTADLDPSAGVESLTSAGGYDIYLGKYSLNGEYLCSFRVGGPADDGGHALVSTAPNVFCLTGAFSGTNIDFDPASATVNLSSAGGQDIFLTKYTWPDNVPPTGALAGDVICTGEQAQLTFTATAGTGPFTITYNNGTTDIVQTNVQSGVPFNISPNPSVTTTYTLVGIRDALRCSETNPGSGSTVVTVNTCNATCNDWLQTPTLGSKVLIGDLDITGDQITVEASFNRTQPLNNGIYYGHLVSKHTGPSNVNYALLPNGCEITTTGSGYQAVFQDCPLELNRTYHVAMVYNGSTLKFYRNGNLLSQVPCTGNMINNDLITAIGQFAGGSDPFNNQFLGYINEVRIWNVARTQADIRVYMDATLPNPTTQPGLRAYYVFNDAVNDQGNIAWNGSLIGSAAISQTNTNCPLTTTNTCDSVVINDYTEVSALDACKNVLTVGDPSAFNPGDTVLIIQMKGAVIETSNTASFGNITSYGNAGNYEFNYVKSINGNTIELLNILERQYDIPAGKVQLIRVPYYTDFTTTDKLTCLPWDGNKGGVLVFNVANTLTLNHDINVSGKGYKGGKAINTNQSVLNCSSNSYSYPTGSILAAAKGESISTLANPFTLGKGNAAGGGGGGNDHNSGGGGGGNGGTGGFGGYQYEPCTGGPFDNRGIGGKPLAYNPVINKIFMGSGGGAGHSNNPQNATRPSDGGNGGGIILISAQNIISNSNKIISNGTNAPVYVPTATQHAHEAMGGGGAGGTVLLSIPQVQDNTIIQATGGKGADMVADAPLFGKIGPGGGGGGGVLWVMTPALHPNITFDATGGARGVISQSANDPWGTTDGLPGVTAFDLQLPIDDVLFEPNIDSIRINVIRQDCDTYDFEGLAYINNAPIVTWDWFFGDGGTASTQNATHDFAPGDYIVRLIATDANGCKDSFRVNINQADLDFDFSFNQDVCDPMTVQFTGLGNVPANNYWHFGDNSFVNDVITVTHTYGSVGDYIVAYAVSDGICSDTIQKTITIAIEWANIILTQDTTICYGTTKQLLSAPSLDFCWSPVTYLDNPNSPNPVTSTPENITYHLLSQVTGNNLIVNGNFSQGNTGFTSAYQYKPPPNLTEGQYYIGASPQAWNGGLNNCIDHTGSNGNMMLVNGSPVADANVWRQTVTVVPNTNYAFSTWIQALGTPNPAQLQFSINGKNLGSLISASLPPCTWTQFFTTWNSGSSTSAVISIVNMNLIASGNDFALDDISFAQVFIKRDSVIITVDSPMVRTNDDIAICKGDSLQLNTIGAQNYVWTPGPGLTSTTIADPKASPVVSTEYIVTGTNANGCVAKDTVNISLHPVATITKADNAIICSNTPVQIWASGGDSYVWSPSTTLDDPNIPDPTATPVINTMYYVTITDVNSCDYLDSVKVDIQPDPAFRATGPDFMCREDSVLLNAYGGDSYTWAPVDGLSDPDIAHPKASPSTTTTYTVLITESVCNKSQLIPVTIEVKDLPDVQATSSNDLDCTTDRSQLNATGANQYVWTPAGSLSNPRIANPVATPHAETQYVVTGTNAVGCINTDTVVVKMTDLNKGDYLIPNAFTPNGDGLNDCFGIKYWGVVYEIELSIFNRWGERVFYTKDRNGCWDGTFKGVKQDPNVFVYMIKAKTNCEQLVFRKGTFALIR